MRVDAVVDSYIAIIILPSGDSHYFRMRLTDPISSPTTPSSVAADTESGVLPTVAGDDETTALYETDRMSRTASYDISDESPTLSDRTHGSWNASGNGFWQKPLPIADRVWYTVIGPLMYVHFSEANGSSGAGSTVDLLFEDHRYLKASLRFFLFRSVT